MKNVSGRGAGGGGGKTSSGHGFGHSLKAAFHQISWGTAALAAIAGYYLPSTLSNMGLGWLLYDNVPGWSKVTDTLWASTDQMVQQGFATSNPWDNGGLVGAAKLIGGGYLAKEVYDFQKTGRIGRGALNVGIPFGLGMLLDGPELSPQGGMGNPNPGWGHVGADSPMHAQGGVSW